MGQVYSIPNEYDDFGYGYKEWKPDGFVSYMNFVPTWPKPEPKLILHYIVESGYYSIDSSKPLILSNFSSFDLFLWLFSPSTQP